MTNWLQWVGIFALATAWVGGSAALFAQGATVGNWKYVAAGGVGGCIFLATLATLTSH